MKKELRFPTIFGVIFLIVAIFAGVYLSGSPITLSSKASSGCNPENVQVTNLTHVAASISFITSATCQASLDVNNQTVEDLRLETINNPDLATHLHYFEIKRLKEKTTYDFSVISGGNYFNSDGYKFTTGSSPSSETPNSNLAWGKVMAEDGQTPGVALVYLNIPGAYPLSSVVTTNGNWSVSLANSFNESKTNWFSLPSAAIDEDIIVISEEGVFTQVVNSTSHNNPVPNITIGKNSLDAPEEIPIDDSQIGQFDSITPVPDQKSIDIANPKNGDMLEVSRPDFFGSAPINSRVIIEVHSDQLITGEAYSDASGAWHWSPPENLAPGEHTITAKSLNGATGIWETITHSFTVLATDGSDGPSFEASGSAGTPSPTIAPTIAPTIVPTQTPEPTIRVARPSTTVEPPVTGNSLPTMGLVLFSCVFLLFSFKLLR